MVCSLYATRDELSGFGAPLIDSNDDSAIRNFRYAMLNNDVMAFSAECYSLYRVGTFDSDSGALVPIVPVLLIRGSDVKG